MKNFKFIIALFLGFFLGALFIGYLEYYAENELSNRLQNSLKEISEKKEKIEILEKYIYFNKETTFLMNEEEKKMSIDFINKIRKSNFNNIKDMERIYIEPQNQNSILVCGRDFPPGIWDIYHTQSDYKNDFRSTIKFNNNEWRSIYRMKRPTYPKDSSYRDDFVNDKEFKIGDYIELTRISSWGLTLAREKEKEQLKN